MSARIYSLGEAVATGEVDIFGSVFEVRPITSSVEAALNPLERKYNALLEKADSTTGTSVVEAIGELLDVLLKPAEGGKSKPSKLLLEKWQADELAIPDARDLVQAVAEHRPT
jgi:hypothetical protein